MGYNSVTEEQSNISMNMKDVRYALMPVWVLSTRYKDQVYQFVMNGQTGKVSGKLPIDKKKMWITALIEFFAITIVLFIIGLLILL